MHTLKSPFYYAVFENGVNVRKMFWEDVKEIPAVFYLEVVKDLHNSVKNTNWASYHTWFRGRLLDSYMNPIAFKINKNTLIAIDIFHNSANSPQVYSAVSLKLLTETLNVIQILKDQKIGAADPMDRLKDAFQFASQFVDFESCKEDARIKDIDGFKIFLA